jgi:adenylosuccinate lyase
MMANLESLGGVVHSGEVLLALTRAGISREDAYAIVQRNAMATWENLGTPMGRSFRDNLERDPEVASRMTPEKLDQAMDPRLHLGELDRVFTRVFGDPGPAATCAPSSC